MTPTHTLRHALPADLPAGWSWPARPSKRGYWVLTYDYGDRENDRALHLCVAEVEGIDGEPCWWCGTVTAARYVIDHVDGDKSNNLPSNLVRACNSCNRRKGAQYWGHGPTWVGEVHRCVDRRMCDMGVSE